MIRAAVLLLLAVGLPALAGPAEPLAEGDAPATTRARRRALAEEIGAGVVVLLSGPFEEVLDSRPDPDLRRLAGVTAPRAALVLHAVRPEATERSRAARRLSHRIRRLAADLESRARALLEAGSPGEALEAIRAAATAADAAADADRLAREEAGRLAVRSVLYLPAPDARRRRWSGPSLAADEAARAATGVEEVRPLSRLAADLAALPAGEIVWHRPRARTSPSLEPALAALDRSDLVHADPAPVLARLRAVKDEEEIARIRRACELTAEGLRDAMRTCEPGMPEYGLQAVLEFACRRGGAVRQAFRSIVASGPNAVILHYDANRRAIEAGDLVLMDVGAEYGGYAADVTRTFPASGRFRERQAAIYDVVLAAQRAGLAAVRPGANLRIVDAAARKVIADAGYGPAFLHATSHWVGLDVHDPCDVRAPLVPGMVLTVEPGIYLVDEGLGVRIEDTVLVTADGAEVLSAGVPKERAAIESLMAD